MDAMEEALQKIRDIEGYDRAYFEPYVSSLEEQISILEDLAADLRSYGEEMESQPERLDQVENRLDQIQHLKNKYGQSRELVMTYYEKTKTEQERLQNLKETMEKLERQIDRKQQEMEKIAVELSQLRVRAARRIEQEITEVLATLQFNEPIFKVSCEAKELSPKGVDQVVFQIRTNVGEALRPLHQIVSGGEMSRVMLAIKTVLAKQDEIGALIFDEIDTGISGRTAQSVAEKMSKIAGFHQVICVTHLPQIAALADCHMLIRKTVSEEHTATHISQLEPEQITEELARMLGGAEITDAVRENAMEMKKLADEWKKLR